MKEQLLAPDSESSSESCGEEEREEEISVASLKGKEVDFLQRSVIYHKNILEFQRITDDDITLSCYIFSLAFPSRLVERCLCQYPEDYDSNMRTAASGCSLSERERHALHLCIGQQKCLMALRKLLGDMRG